MDSTQEHKKAMLKSLEKNLGVVTSACKSVGISRQTHYNWLKDDAKYKAAVDELENVALDYAESKLHNQITKENPTAIIFYLKTKGKKRGYIERQEISHEGIQTFTIEEIDGEDSSQ
tara:strand:+ start:3856 stop:4206 length:351 start_codon:yes stop_codon:yes gene_type:complete